MRALINYMERVGNWTVHMVSEDCKTPIGPFVPISSVDTLYRLLEYCGATPAEVEEVRTNVRRWAAAA